ncbi:DNA-binding protein [Rathayibacter sp. Leaf299]|uniref:helix-turn-helix domain-containing protein n=1 Tax=Rathayibacter sp. Leaf299 TaxID=1736328 RepID=UPI0006FD0A65|nr:helix-turn-helix domain-containing protein [Rathayibacter sp. Leaf299]KQQ20606.1 DNA-binding protein [Rathayibacter sp. Leaf299]
MVRAPLTPEQLEAGRRLGETLRRARGPRTLNEIAGQAGLSPETLRKIETGRLPSPAFGTVAALAAALDLSLDALALEWATASARVARPA